MGVFLIFAILVVVFIGIIIRGRYLYAKSRGVDDPEYYYYWVGGVGLACTVIAMLICALVALIVGCQRQVKYQQHLLTYQVMSARLEEVDSNNYYLFVDEINDYNNAILSDRYWSDNLWVNWYHNGKIKDLPLIGEGQKNERG